MDPNKVKTIRINYLVTSQKFDVTVKNSDTVKDLKSKIADKIGGGITLINLMIQPNTGRNPRPLPDNDELTILDAQIHNLSKITIGRDNVKGGN